MTKARTPRVTYLEFPFKHALNTTNKTRTYFFSLFHAPISFLSDFSDLAIISVSNVLYELCTILKMIAMRPVFSAIRAKIS